MNNKSKYKHVPTELFSFNRESAAKFRSLRFKYAVATSLGSKVTTSVVQLVALPIAVKALGTEQFALYAMLAAVVGWLGLVNIGIGPVLTVNIASATARGDREAEKRLLTSALIPILIGVCLTGIAVYLSVYLLDVAVIFGNNYLGYSNVVRIGVSILAGFAFLQIIFSVVEAAQAGYQEQYKQNLMAMSSNIFSVGAIIAVAIYYPTVIGMILAVNIFPFLFRLLNALLVFRKRPFLFPSVKYFNFSDCKSLLYNGLAFSLAGGLGNFLCHVFPVILVGRMLNANSSTSFAVAMNALIVAAGILSMVNIPLWPAISDSLARADIGWTRRAYYRTLVYCMGYALFIGITFVFFGQKIFFLWFGSSVVMSYSLTVFLGIYFVLLAWESIHYTVLLGMKHILMPSFLYLAKSILSVMAMLLLINKVGEIGPFVSLCIFTAAITIVPLSYLVYRELFCLKPLVTSTRPIEY